MENIKILKKIKNLNYKNLNDKQNKIIQNESKIRKKKTMKLS